MEASFGRDEALESVQHKPLKEEIFEILHNRIIAGKVPPGEWLRQEEFSSQLGVSQTPVREALDLLVSAGLAERVPYRGVRVLQLTNEEIVDAYGLRLLLEGTAARMCALAAAPEQVEHLRDLLEQTKPLIALSDMSEQRLLNRRFHNLLVEYGGNPLLVKLHRLVSNQFPDWMLYEYLFRHPELLQESLSREFQEHEAIVEALAKRDSQAAVRSVVLHIRNLGRELVDYLGVPLDSLRARESQLGLAPEPEKGIRTLKV